MRGRRKTLDALILDIHAAPLDPGRWTPVVRDICDVLRADRGQLFAVRKQPQETIWAIAHEIDPTANTAYSTEYSAEDVWIREGVRRGHLTAGRVSSGEQLIDRYEFLRSRFYNEFLEPYGIDRFLNVVVKPPPSPLEPPEAMLSLYRGPDRTAFERGECRLLGQLAPHLTLALETQWRLTGLTVAHHAALRSLDLITLPLFVVDGTGRLLIENDAGAQALSSGLWLRAVNKSLQPSPRLLEQDKCSKLIHDVLQGRVSSLLVRQRDSAERMIISAAPVSGSQDALFSWPTARALLWLSGAVSATDGLSQIGQIFGVSAAELRLLAKLSDGLDLRRAADALRISIHTARNQLKSAQSKTGWRTQTELIRNVTLLSVVQVPD